MDKSESSLSHDKYKVYKAGQNRIAYEKHSPYPFRLGELHTKLQTDAFHNPELLGSSIHAVGISIIKNYYEKRDVFMETWLQKLIEMAQTNRHNIKNHIPIRKYGSRLKDHPTLF